MPTREDYVRDKPTPSKSTPSAGVPGSPFVGTRAIRIRLLAQAKPPSLRGSATYDVPGAAAAIEKPAMDLSSKRTRKRRRMDGGQEAEKGFQRSVLAEQQ
jgi:hypothetical protein